MTKTGSKGYPVGQFQGIYLRPMSHYRKSRLADPTMRYVEDNKIEAEIERLSRESFKPPDEKIRYDDGTVLLRWYDNPEDAPKKET